MLMSVCWDGDALSKIETGKKVGKCNIFGI